MLTNLDLNTNNATKSKKLKYRVYAADLSSVDTDNWPVAVLATIASNVLKGGEVYKHIDTYIETLNWEGDPGESPLQDKIKITGGLEGVSKAVLDFWYKNRGNRHIVIVERCADNQRFIFGNPCSGGLMLKTEKLGTLENMSGIAFNWEGSECPEPFYFYDGPLPLAAATQIALGAGTTFALTAASQYLMGDNAAAKTLTDITAVTDDDLGRTFELIGDGVNFPTEIEASEVFILDSGDSFSLAKGNRITFKITKTGAATYGFFEVDRATV